MALWYVADGNATFYHIFDYCFTTVGGGMHRVSAIVGSWALISPQSVGENLQTAIWILWRIFSAPELCTAKGIGMVSLRQLSESPSQIYPVMPSSWLFDFLIFRIRGRREDEYLVAAYQEFWALCWFSDVYYFPCSNRNSHCSDIHIIILLEKIQRNTGMGLPVNNLLPAEIKKWDLI